MSAVEVPVAQGYTALVDVEDAAVVLAHPWSPTKGPRGLIYAVTGVRRIDGSWTTLKMHRLILGLPTRYPLVDHQNHNGLDNQRSNLRPCTPSQNQGNSRAAYTGKSGYKGVHWHKQRSKWKAEIMVNRRSRHLGLFEDPWEAAQAYNAAALDAWGEFAYLNTYREATP